MLATERQDEASSRLLAVIGASGSGKSSVVMAGLLYQMQQGVLPASRDWLYLDPMVPGKHPLEALTLTLSHHFPVRSLSSISEDLQADSTRGLHLLMTSLVKGPDTKAVLFIDQFEELFTQTSSEDERRHFLDILITAITEPGGSVITLLTMRADFYDRPLRYPEIGRLIEARRVVMFSLEMNDFREVIEQPARLRGYMSANRLIDFIEAHSFWRHKPGELKTYPVKTKKRFFKPVSPSESERKPQRSRSKDDIRGESF
jgi:hypothetical protein